MTSNAPHGEIARYSAGCRCDECKKANAAYQKDYRNGIRRTRKRWRRQPDHGTYAKFYRGCRCGVCVDAAKRDQFARQIKNRHGMTIEVYWAILSFQENVCAICSMPGDESGEHFSIDHKHSCPHDPGKSCSACWRGLLCRSCNGQLERLIGHAYINEIDGVASQYDGKILQYVRDPPAQVVLRARIELAITDHPESQS